MGVIRRFLRGIYRWIMGRYMVIEDDEGPTDPDIKPIFEVEHYGGLPYTKLPNGETHFYGKQGWS